MIFLPPHAHTTTTHGAEVHVFSTARCELAEVRATIPLLRESAGDAAAAAALEKFALQPNFPSQHRYRDMLLQNGAEFNVSLMTDKLFISGICPPDKIAKCLSIVFEACLSVPTDSEFRHLQHATQTHTQMLSEIPDILLHTENLRRRWGNHPFAWKTSTIPALQQLTRSSYATFVTERIGVADSQFVICVSIPDDRRLLDKFATKIADEVCHLPAHNLRQYPETNIPPVDPGSYQLACDGSHTVATMQLMMPAPLRTSSDHAAFRAAATILGGYPNSRLLTQLRDKLGIVYQVSSHTDDYRSAANLTFSLKTPLNLRQETATRFTESITNFIKHGPTQEEVNDAVRFLINSTAVSWANPAGFGSAQAALLSTGANLGYWNHLASALAGLTADDVAQAAGRYMAEDTRILGSIARP